MPLSKDFKALISKAHNAKTELELQRKKVAEITMSCHASANVYSNIVKQIQEEARKGVPEGTFERLLSIDGNMYIVRLSGPPTEDSFRVLLPES